MSMSPQLPVISGTWPEALIPPILKAPRVLNGCFVKYVIRGYPALKKSKKASIYCARGLLQECCETRNEQDKATEISKTSRCKDGPTLVVLSVSPRVRVMEVVVWFLLVHAGIGGPHRGVWRERKLKQSQ